MIWKVNKNRGEERKKNQLILYMNQQAYVTEANDMNISKQSHFES